MELKELLTTAMNVMGQEKELSEIEAKAKKNVESVENSINPLGWVASIIIAIIVSFIVTVVIAIFSHWNWFIFFGILIVLTLVLYYTSRSSSEKARQTYDMDIANARRALDEATAALEAFHNSEDYIYIMEHFPKAYYSVDCIMIFCQYAENCRADTLKEAINLYEAEKRDAEKLELQKKQLEATLKASEESKAIAEKQLKISKKQKDIQNWAAWGIWMKK